MKMNMEVTFGVLASVWHIEKAIFIQIAVFIVCGHKICLIDDHELSIGVDLIIKNSRLEITKKMSQEFSCDVYLTVIWASLMLSLGTIWARNLRIQIFMTADIVRKNVLETVNVIIFDISLETTVIKRWFNHIWLGYSCIRGSRVKVNWFAFIIIVIIFIIERKLAYFLAYLIYIVAIC